MFSSLGGHGLRVVVCLAILSMVVPAAAHATTPGGWSGVFDGIWQGWEVLWTGMPWTETPSETTATDLQNEEGDAGPEHDPLGGNFIGTSDTLEVPEASVDGWGAEGREIPRDVNR